MKMLHIGRREAAGRVWVPAFRAELETLGELEIVERGEDLSDAECADRIRACEVLFTCWDARPVPEALAGDRGKLAYICHITGEMRRYIPLSLIEVGIPVTNWGDAQANQVAEGAMVLLLAMVKNLRRRIEVVARGGWRIGHTTFTGTLEGLNVGLYGCGVIGRRFVEMIRPFRPVLRVFDPYASQVPEGCERVESLEALFGASEAVVIHAGLTDETRRSVTAPLLALLPDNGILINTARGGIVDEAAIYAELETGRLLAALDVLDPDRPPPEDHPVRQWPNAVLTAHSIGSMMSGEQALVKTCAMHRICVENLKRYLKGEPLRFVMDRERYERST